MPAHPREIDASCFINRELSWLAFNERVLLQAADRALPAYERLKFLGIFSTNLDEFFMVRVAGLKQQVASGVLETPADGMLPTEQVAGISERTHRLVDEQYRIWREEVRPILAEHRVRFITVAELSASDKADLQDYFRQNIFPALTPLAVDAGHPFPHLRNKTLNMALYLRRNGTDATNGQHAKYLAVVQVPGVLSRFIPVTLAGERYYLTLGDIIANFAGDIFPGYVPTEVVQFRVTRNWDLHLDEEDSEDLLSTVQQELRRRDRGAAVRLEVNAKASPEMVAELRGALHLEDQDVYPIDGPLQINDLMAFRDLEPRPDLVEEPFVPIMPPLFKEPTSIFSMLRHRDVLLHHPYESFEPVVRFVDQAADDPNVLAIKMTLYRTSGDSPFIKALSRAAENGKQVTAFIEIKARFDEERNIDWANHLEENGVHVAYGLIGLKTHCKCLMVVRREGEKIRRYVHLGTGNYNPTTARLYTDLSLFTTRQEIAEDMSALFNLLTGYSDAPDWKQLAVAPMDLQLRILSLIERETKRAYEGQPSRIIAKMNSLVDPTVIRALYAASQAGVEIHLVVRGICCLRAGVAGLSENIRVVSIVDRFLEHPRVFVFGVEDPDVFGSSADWMPRNFLRRIETMFPIKDPVAKQRVIAEVLGASLHDNIKAHTLQSDDTYMAVPQDGEPTRSQYAVIDMIKGSGQKKSPPRSNWFTPRAHIKGGKKDEEA